MNEQGNVPNTWEKSVPDEFIRVIANLFYLVITGSDKHFSHSEDPLSFRCIPSNPHEEAVLCCVLSRSVVSYYLQPHGL